MARNKKIQIQGHLLANAEQFFFSFQAGKGLFHPDEWHAQKTLNPIKRQKFIRIVIL